MITWDGVLRSQQQRREWAALHLPGFPLKSSAGKPAVPVMHAAGAGTAAGTPPPHRGTGSHHKTGARDAASEH